MRLDPKPLLLAGMLMLPALVLPPLAAAETVGRDVAYCRALSNIYVRYIGWNDLYGDHARHRANNDAQVAVAKCHEGDPSGIPVLERELTVNKFALPPRG